VFRLKADLVLRSGKIITVDEKETIVEAVAVKHGKIIAVGRDKEIDAYISSNTKIIDLKGRTVLPGLMDSHGHFAREGMDRMRLVDLSQEAGSGTSRTYRTGSGSERIRHLWVCGSSATKRTIQN
jgi:predicted amidohydrolase YtcJ